MMWFMDKELLENLDLGAYDAAAIAKRLDMPVDVLARFVEPARHFPSAVTSSSELRT